MVIDVFLTLEDTVGLDHEEGVERLAGFALVEPRHAAPVAAAGPLARVAFVVQRTGGNHLVVVVGEVGADVVAKVLAQLVLPVHEELDTGVADLTLVHLHGVTADGDRPAHRLVLDQVEGALVIVVGGDAQAVIEHIDIQTGVELLGGFPGQFIVDGVGRIPEGAEDGTLVDTIVGGLVPVGAAQGVGLVVHADGTQITHAAPGSTELQQGDGIALREERLAGDLPRTGHGREVAAVVLVGQTAGIVPAPGGGDEVTVVEAVGETADESDVAVRTVEIVAVEVGRRGELEELVVRVLILEAGSAAAEALLLPVVHREGTQGAHGVLAEGTVIGKGVLTAPLESAGGAQAQAVGDVDLTDLTTGGAEGLGVRIVDVQGEQGGELEPLDRREVQAGGGPEVHVVPPLRAGIEHTERVHDVTVDIGEVAAVLGDVLGILGGGTAEGTGVRAGRGISLGGRRHPEGGQKDTRVGGAVIHGTAPAVVVGHDFRELEPLVHLVFAVVSDSHILLVGVVEDTLVILVVEGQTALEHVRTVVERHGVALVGSRAENLVHPVGALNAHPRVDGGVPTGRQGDAGILVGDGLHPDLFLGRQRLRKVGSAADTGHEIVFHVNALVGLLGGHEDDAAGTGGGTVNSGGGRVLQDDDALDFVHRVDGRTRDTVHDPQHGVAVTGTLAADEEAGAAVGVTAVVGNDHTRNLALQHVGDGSHRTFDDLVGVADDTHGSGQVLLLGLGTVTKGDGFLEDLSVLFQDDDDARASVDGHLLGHITEAGDFKDCVGRDIDGEGTVHVRNGVGSATEQHGSHDGTGGVIDGSSHCQVLRRRAERCRKAHEPREQSEQFFGNHNG